MMFIPRLERRCINAGVRRCMLVYDVVFTYARSRVRELLRDGWESPSEWTGEGKRIVADAFAEYGVGVYVDAVGGTGSSYLIFTA